MGSSERCMWWLSATDHGLGAVPPTVPLEPFRTFLQKYHHLGYIPIIVKVHWYNKKNLSLVASPVAADHREGPWRLLAYNKPDFWTGTRSYVLETYSSRHIIAQSGWWEMRPEVAQQFRGDFFFFFSVEVCWQCEKLEWIMKQSICKHPSGKSHKLTPKVLVHPFTCFSCTFTCVTLCLEDQPWQRSSRVLAWIIYEQTLIRCSYHEWLAPFSWLLFRACCPFRAKHKTYLRVCFLFGNAEVMFARILFWTYAF